ncbi:26S proteasome non-ATPase regulatory subunit 6, partial [Leucoagaricus sp. SymC.cos]
TVLPIPNLALPQHLFVLTSKDQHTEASLKLLEGIQADRMLPFQFEGVTEIIGVEMAPYHKSKTSTFSVLSLDKALLELLKKANEDELEILDEQLAEAERQEGESEISDALKARANYLTRIGDKDRAVEDQKLALEKTSGLRSWIDIVLTLVRIGFFFGDHDLINAYVTKAEALIEEGGDWGRRNCLKVYNGLHLLSI